jgi:hypothetical protein
MDDLDACQRAASALEAALREVYAQEDPWLRERAVVRAKRAQTALARAMAKVQGRGRGSADHRESQ